MGSHDHLFERRKYARFLVNEGALAFVASKYGKIIDVSMQGLSFEYIIKANKPSLIHHFQTKNFTLDITFSIYDFCLVDLPIVVISDQEMKTGSNHRAIMTKRRCGVHFKDLATNQESLLKRFIILNQFGSQYI